MSKVVKFGGSSLASAEQFQKVGKIIKAEAERRFVVPSAPGKRFSADTKVTDMLYGCYDLAEAGKDFKAESNKALMISVTGMAVADYDQAVTCTVYDANDKEIISATDSVACYVLRAKAAEADNPLFDTVLKFGYSAYQAFKK